MFIIPRLKCWLKAIELFVIQIPISLFSYFASALLTFPFIKDALIAFLIFYCLFLLITSFFFAYYFDWGKENPTHNLKVLPSKQGFLEGVAMALIALTSNLIASIPLSSDDSYTLGYDLSQFFTKFQSPNETTVFFILLWLYIASHGFQLRAKLFKKSL